MKRARRMQRIKRGLMVVALIFVLGKLGLTVYDTVQQGRCQEDGGTWDGHARSCTHE